jgi:hypothetical protein
MITAKTLRRRYLSVPGRIACSGRKVRLHLPIDWPWELQFLSALQRVRALLLA